MNLPEILIRTAKIHNTHVSLLKSKSRVRELVLCRCHYYKIAREQYDYTLIPIGWHVNRGHDTVLYGINKINTEHGRLKLYEDFYNEFFKDNLSTEFYESQIIKWKGKNFLDNYKKSLGL